MGSRTKCAGPCALALTVLGMAGCDRLTATVQAISALTQSPDLGETIEDDYLAMVLPLDRLGGERITAALGWIGSRDSITSTAPPEPLGGALVSIKWGPTSVPMCESPGTSNRGTYLATDLSIDERTGAASSEGGAPTGCADQRLQYLPGTLYTTEFETATDLFVLQVTAPEPLDPTHVVVDPPLTPSAEAAALGLSLPTHPAGSALLLDWAAHPGESDVFVTVYKIDFTGSFPLDLLERESWQVPDEQPIFDNLPRDAHDILNLIAGSPQTRLELSGNLLSSGGLYLVVLTATAVSYDASPNLSLGSAATAGAGTGFVVFVDAP